MKQSLAWAAAIVLIAAVFGCRPRAVVSETPPTDRHTPYDFRGRRGMVVAAHPLAAEAGLDMLKRGGNAVDAAVATAFALNAAEPFASGIGGGGFMVIHLAAANKTTVINFRETAPAAAGPAMFKDKGEARDEWRQKRGTAVGVPGALAGWSLALTKYGRKSLAQAAERAIEIAEHGFPASEMFSTATKDEYDKLVANAGEASAYLNAGLPYEPGEIFRNPDLAKTLRLLAAQGIDPFYRGELARKIAAAVRARDGIMTVEDLASYRPEETEPLRGTYKGYEIRTPPPPATGGLHLLQLLDVAEAWPLKEWGPNSAAAIHHLSEAMRFIFADKDRYDADPDFLPVPVDALLSRASAGRLRALIRPDRTAGTYPAARFDPIAEKMDNTTHVAVVDAEGNVVALTQSINDFFGCGIVPQGTGFLLNDHMADFSPDPESPNAPRPGRRPASNMAPLIAFKNGRPFLTIGSPGGTRIFPSLAQIFLNIVEFGLSIDEAIEAPRFFSSSTEGRAQPIALEPRIPESVRRALESLGHKITLKEPYDKYFGGAQGILIAAGKTRLLGGADSRRDGVGRGY